MLISSLVSFAKLSIKNQDVSPAQLEKQNKQIVQLAATEISKQLPQKIDRYTTITQVLAQDTNLIYVHEIRVDAKSDDAIIKEDHSRMQKAITKGVCRTSQRFLEAKINLTYRYISAVTKRKLFEFNINEQTCLDLSRR
jgi:hypothetical protein